jgi:hypothetical protein
VGVLCAAAFTGSAQVVIQRIDPAVTDPAIEMVRGPHLALYDPQVPSRHRLLLFIGGTRSTPESSLKLDTAFTSWGFHAISLDYEDGVVAVSCAHSQDSTCFDHYRETIITGKGKSDKISVTPANSILNRVEKLLNYLVQHDPDSGWKEFVEDGHPRWSRIVVAGHSQGSGHAAYIAKMFRVDRALIFSGPQDYLADLHEPAPWQSRASATPVDRYFAFLSENDTFHVERQIANCAALMKLDPPKPEHVTPGGPITGHPQILVNDFPKAARAHGSTLLPQYQNVWKYMATVKP